MTIALANMNLVAIVWNIRVVLENWYDAWDKWSFVTLSWVKANDDSLWARNLMDENTLLHY